MKQEKLWWADIEGEVEYIVNTFKKCNINLTMNQAYLAYHNWSLDFWFAGWECGLMYWERQRVIDSLINYIPENKRRFYKPFKFNVLDEKYGKY
jgi:hypothetical protein